MQTFSLKSTTSLVLCLSLATPTFAQQAATPAQPFPCASGDGQLVQDGKEFANLLIANLTTPDSQKTSPAPADLPACGTEAVARAVVWGGDALAQAQSTAPADLVARLMPTTDAEVAAQATVDATAEAPAATDQAAADQAAADAAAAEQAAADQAAADAAAAEQAAADQAAADAAAAEQAATDQAAADAAAAEQAAADQAAADAATAEQAATDQAAADAAAAEQAIADQAAADAAAAQQAATDQAAADAAAAEQAIADQAAADAAAAEQAATDQAAADAAAAEQAAADQAAADAAATEQTATDQAAADAAAADQAQTEQAKTDVAAAAAAIAAQAEADANAAATVEATPAREVKAEGTSTIAADTSAETATPPVTTDTASVPQDLTPEQQAARDARRAERQAAGQASAAAQAAATDMANAANVVTEEVTQDDVRTADQDFLTAVTGAASAAAATDTTKADKGLSTFEKALLLGLGAVAVGAILNNGDQVVSNSGDRVVVQRDGELRVLKNDDVLLRQPGAEVATQTFDDGSTLTVVTRTDGSKVTTIRSADGTVLRRSLTRADGTDVQLIDDLTVAAPVEVSSLPPVPQEVITTSSIAMTDQAALQTALTANLLAQTNRTYSLEQVRDIRQLRALAPQVELAAITFDTGSSAIQPSQAEQLAALGGAIRQIVANDPGTIFLIEGHTDAVGDAGYNLALSDRRAETVALALTEYFQVPPENLVTQGYGESILKVQTSTAERANRRAAVRNITALLQQS